MVLGVLRAGLATLPARRCAGLQKLAQALEVEPSELARLMSEVAEEPKLRGSLVKDIRVRRGMNQVYVAHLAGISQSFLSNLERGKHEASPPTVLKLARALGVTPTELLGG